MVKEINIIENNIEILEEKKRIFGTKQNITKINIESIDKIERILENKKLIGITIWNKDTVLFAIGIKNYKDDLEEIYNKIVTVTKSKSVKISEIKL